jgi:hypothetical protein
MLQFAESSRWRHHQVKTPTQVGTTPDFSEFRAKTGQALEVPKL